MEDIFACSHMRVTKLYTESINSACPFMAYTCSSFTNFKVKVKKSNAIGPQ